MRRSATGSSSKGVTTRNAVSLFTGAGPGATLAVSASTPPSAKSLRQRRTVSSRTPNASAIRGLVQPDSVSSTARDLSASPRSREPASAARAARCSSVAVIGDFPAMSCLCESGPIANQTPMRGSTNRNLLSYYPVMSFVELCALPVAEVATNDAFLFLWCPAAGLEEHGLPLLRAWGFAFKTHAVWDKLSGGYGTGAYWRMEYEDLLLGVRPGSPTHFNDDTMSSMIRVKRSRNHSEKPEDAHRIMERAISGPYLELFARQHVSGWDCYGNQLAPVNTPPKSLVAE